MFSLSDKNLSKSHRLQHVQQKIQHICQFLENYLPFADSHITDFFVSNLWDDLLSEEIKQQLLGLTVLQLSQLPNCLQTETSSCYNVTTCPVTSSEGQDNRESKIEELKFDTGRTLFPGEDLVSERETSLSGSSCTSGVIGACEEQAACGKRVKVIWKHRTLWEFVHAASQVSLSCMEILVPVSTLLTTHPVICVTEFMSQKKSHEVEVMSTICACICEKMNIKQVIDIGSGRGYLSSHLSLKHKLAVIGIDSSSTNSGSALNRQGKLEKQWTGLVKRAEFQSQGFSVKRGRKKQTSHSVKNKCNECGLRVHADTLVSITSPNAEETTMKLGGEMDRDSPSHDSCIGKSSQDSFIPLTMHITADSDLGHVLQAHAISPCPSRVLLAGLHTCGSLASSVLQLFVNNAYASAVCNVGCCYQHLEECTGCDEGVDASAASFPMSSYLKEQQFTLGRKSRMLASQSVERGAQMNREPSVSLYWRALLQVILRDVVGCMNDDWRVGKIANKCTNFCQYVRRAFKKLGFSLELSDEDILSYEQHYNDQQRHLQCFFQLRTVLGRCIESLILLDRVCFLLEQESVSEVYISQFFDPVVSPRCYGIVAIKG